jgi:hypothetical protein
MFVCCDCCVLSGRGLCDELITRPEETYRLWCVVVCDLETSRMRKPWAALDRSATKKESQIDNLRHESTVQETSWRSCNWPCMSISFTRTLCRNGFKQVLRVRPTSHLLLPATIQISCRNTQWGWIPHKLSNYQKATNWTINKNTFIMSLKNN